MALLQYWPVDVFFFQAEDGIRDLIVTGVQTCALPIYDGSDDDQHERFRDVVPAIEADERLAREHLDELRGADHRSAVGVPVEQELVERSEERRVGKECRSRWSPYH